MALFSAIRGRPAVLTNALHHSLKTLAGVDKVVCLGKQVFISSKNSFSNVEAVHFIFLTLSCVVVP